MATKIGFWLNDHVHGFGMVTYSDLKKKMAYVVKGYFENGHIIRRKQGRFHTSGRPFPQKNL